MAPVLALYEDVLSDGAALALPAAARMIFLTGGAFTASARAFLERAPLQWLEKPVDAETLRRVVRAAVQGDLTPA